MANETIPCMPIVYSAFFCDFILLGIRVSFCRPILVVPLCLEGAQHLVSELEHCSIVEELGSSVKRRAVRPFQMFDGQTLEDQKFEIQWKICNTLWRAMCLEVN